MEFKVPAFLVLAGPAAAALEEDLQASLPEHLSADGLSGVMLWRVDPPEKPAKGAPARAPFAVYNAAASRDFQWKTLKAGNYFEAAFVADFGDLLNRQNPNRGMLNHCYLCVVACGAQVTSETLAAIRDRTADALGRIGRSIRTHLLWLMEDQALRLGDNHQMLIDDLQRGKPCLAGFDRITVLSAIQGNGAQSLATRRQQLDALVPCMLETANTDTLGGELVQTAAYRKLNCTRNEIRRLRAHRAAEALADMQALPMDQDALWQCFTTEDTPLSRFSEQDDVAMAQSLMYEIRLELPGALDLLVTDEPAGPDNPAQMVAEIQAHNDAALLDALGGDSWWNGWEKGVREKVRRCLSLRTVADFAGPRGVLRRKLEAVALAAEDQGIAHARPYPDRDGDGGDWFPKPGRRYRSFERTAQFYLEGLAYRALARRLRLILRGLEGLLVHIRGLLAASERTLSPYRLSEEETALYHAYAEYYDEELTGVLYTLKTDVRAVFGTTREFYSADDRELADTWRAAHEGLMARLEQANAAAHADFIAAYVLRKTTAELEGDLREKLSGASWQLAGCDIADTGRNVTYAGVTLARLFPDGHIMGGPLRSIPGDLVEHIRFGDVARSVEDLAKQFPFRPVAVWKPDSRALRDRQNAEEPESPVSQPAISAPKPAQPNPWQVRLERKPGAFLLYWLWPKGFEQPATIRLEHADGVHMSLTCSLAQYLLLYGMQIPTDRLGVGRNRITVYHGDTSHSIQAIGCRISVEYTLTQQSRRKRVTVNNERLDLFAWTLSYRLEDPTLTRELRLGIDTGFGVPVLHGLPLCEPTAEGLWRTRFWTGAEAVTFSCTPEAGDMLEFIRVTGV